MDFNTGTGGTGGSGGTPPGGPEGSGGPRPSMAAAPGGDFNLQDPVQSFISTARSVALDPANFFRNIRRRGDFVNPLVFALICAVINGVLSGVIGFVVALGGDGAGAAFGALLSGVIGVPIATAIGLFIGAAIFHLLVMLIIRPSHEGFEATFRVGAYASVTQLVSWLSVIPILGVLISLVVGLYSIFLGVVGIREVHSTTTGKAALVVLIPVAVGVFIALVLVAIIGAVLFSVMNNQ